MQRAPAMFVALAVMVVGCSQADSEEPPTRVVPRTCLPGDGVSGSPQTIEDTVALINSFPKPVSMPCLLESLDRPIELSATANIFSAQPAFGPNNPRIFIVRNEALVLALVPKGDGRPLLEFGYQVAPTRSLKAELHFPIEADLEPSAPYTRVEYDGDDRDGTTCSFCHFNETRETSIEFANAYVSEVVDIQKFDRVELDYLRWAFEECDPTLEPDRCAMLDSIFAHGEVNEVDY